MSGTAPGQASRFARLTAFLAQDPENAALLADAADAAFAEEQFDAVEPLLDRLAALAPLAPRMHNLAGVAAMRREAWDDAAERFGALLAEGADGPPVRFNLAWSLAMAKRFDEALPLLDEATSAEIAQAAQLEVQLLHQAGEYERAGERARVLVEAHPDHRGLNAAVSTLAIDIDDAELALRTARKAGDHPDALTTLGTLALGDDRPGEALPLFEAALARNSESPRAWIGQGLVHLLGEDHARGAREIDRGAELFGDHLGSWVAAGWAHLIAGDSAAARARFEKALALDDSFGDSQGSLAVIDLLEGRVEDGRRRTEIALRLDRNGFAAAFASMLLAAGAGDAERAQRIFRMALETPIDAGGRTVAQSLARLAARG